jgi:hypothetical protein
LFRWFVGLGVAKTVLRGVESVGAQLTLALAAYNLARLPKLLAEQNLDQRRPQQQLGCNRGARVQCDVIFRARLWATERSSERTHSPTGRSNQILLFSVFLPE